MEQFHNAAKSTLASGASKEATELTLAEGTTFGTSYGAFPEEVPYRIIVGNELINELMKVTAVNKAERKLTVERGVEGSEAAEHAEGAKVTAIVTKAQLEALVQHGLAQAKGDILGATGPDEFVRRKIGADSKVLGADSAQADGLNWLDRHPIGAAANPEILEEVLQGVFANVYLFTSGTGEATIKGATSPGAAGAHITFWVVGSESGPVTIKHEDESLPINERFQLTGKEDLTLNTGDRAGFLAVNSGFLGAGWGQIT